VILKKAVNYGQLSYIIDKMTCDTQNATIVDSCPISLINSSYGVTSIWERIIKDV